MKYSNVIALLLALCMVCACAFGCVATSPKQPEQPQDEQQGNDNAQADNAEQEKAQVFTMGNIRNEIGQYTIVRPDSQQELTEISVLLRNIATEKTGQEPGITTDYIIDKDKFDPEAPEILIGNTTRAESATAMAQLTDKTPYLITQVGNKICIVAKTVKNVIAGVNEFLGVYFNYQTPEFVYHNVRDYGADGDGMTDDSLAFKKAIKAAEKDGLPVYVPAGTYLVTETLTLNCVTMYGYESGSWTADATDLPTIYHNNLEEPLFDVCSGSLSGVNIHVQGTSANSTDAAETIKVSGVGSHLSNIRMHTPWIGINATYNNTGRSVIENIFIIQAWKVGVDISGTWDVATLQNIEVWNNGDTCPTAFRFGKNDALHAVNLFCFNATVGFEFYYDKTNDGGCWASFDNCGVDYTSIGISVGDGTHHLTFTGGTFWNHHHSLKINANAAKDTLVTLSGCEIVANGASPIDISGGMMTTVTGCNITRIVEGHSADPINITGGLGVTIVGNTICTQSNAATIGSAFKGGANITGNTIVTSAKAQSDVFNIAAKKATVNTANNVVLYEHSYK